MDTAINFYELKIQLAGLGFNEPAVLDQLREIVLSAKLNLPDIEQVKGAGDDQAYFTLFLGRGAQGQYELTCIDCSMDNLTQPGCRHMQYFQPDVMAAEAIELLKLDRLQSKIYRDSFIPLNRTETQTHIHLLKTNTIMNTENLSYLQKQLLNMGFGEQMNGELENNIKASKKEFTLSTTQEYNKQPVDYTLHYKAGDNHEMYFFNKYDAALTGKDMQQTFYINKGSGVTAKEAYNLMEGRAVHKQLENLEEEKYHAWIILDKENKTDNGNYKLRHFTENWNYKPERAIDNMNIVGIQEDGAREKLLKSLKKGNRHQVTAIKDGKEVKLYLEANPAEHRVNLTNYKGEPQKLENYKKQELKNEQKQAQQQEDAPVKKQRKGAKQHI
jgi:hypothetical protein